MRPSLLSPAATAMELRDAASPPYGCATIRPMRFLFSTTPGIGHLLPMLPLARAARDRGHDVVIAGGSSLAPTIAAAGFRHAPMGPTLIHLATIDLEAEGQAFSWAQDGSRTVFTVDRRKGLVRRIEIPAVQPADPRISVRFR